MMRYAIFFAATALVSVTPVMAEPPNVGTYSMITTNHGLEPAESITSRDSMGPDGTVPTTRISSLGLDLSTEYGRQQFRERVHTAVSQICQTAGISQVTGGVQPSWRSCQDDTLAMVMPQLDAALKRHTSGNSSLAFTIRSQGS